MNPAAAAPSAARTNSAPELTRTCSLSIISSTAPANAPPRAERQVGASGDLARSRARPASGAS